MQVKFFLITSKQKVIKNDEKCTAFKKKEKFSCLNSSNGMRLSRFNVLGNLFHLYDGEFCEAVF